MASTPQMLGSPLSCSGCGLVVAYTPVLLRDWLKGSNPACEGCGASFDLWARMLHSASAPIPLLPLGLAGATTIAATFPVPHDGVVRVNFTDLGIPTNGTILWVQHTAILNGSDGHFIFLPFTGQSLPIRTIPRNLAFYGHPSTADYTGIDLQVTATWTPEPAPGTHWPQLVAAFDAYSHRRFDEAVIPANIAVEATLRELIRPTLGRSVGNTNLDPFMDVATYGHQWNVLLPVLADLHGALRLPEKIHGLINRLRRLRNDVGHGNEVAAVSARDQAEILVAAVLAVSYLHLISTTLFPPETSDTGGQ